MSNATNERIDAQDIRAQGEGVRMAHEVRGELVETWPHAANDGWCWWECRATGSSGLAESRRAALEDATITLRALARAS